MAEKAPAESEKAKTKSVPLEMVPSSPPKLGRIYSNIAEISHSPWDFTIRFCDGPPSSDIPKLRKGNKLEVNNIVEVIISIHQMPNLIKALQKNYSTFLKSYKRKADESED